MDSEESNDDNNSDNDIEQHEYPSEIVIKHKLYLISFFYLS